MSYGVLVGKVISGQMERGYNTPHYKVTVGVENGVRYFVPINVRSVDRNKPELLYIANSNFNARSITILRTLKPGFHEINYHRNINAGIAVDYIRGNLFNPHDMRVVSHNEPDSFDDLSEFIDEYIRKAMNPHEDALIYVYGTTFNGRGVHNVHMNQGSSKYQLHENGTWHDGCVLIHYRKENKWVGVFLAFQSQSWCTDERGNPKEGSIDRSGYPIGKCCYDTVDV